MCVLSVLLSLPDFFAFWDYLLLHAYFLSMTKLPKREVPFSILYRWKGVHHDETYLPHSLMRAYINTQSYERYYRKVLCNICHCTEGLTKANWFQCSHFGSDSWVEGPPYTRPRPVQHEKFMFPDQLSQGHSRKVVRFEAKAKVAQLSCSWKETRNSCFAEQLRVGVAVDSKQA